jgi:hypothetical protein
MLKLAGLIALTAVLGVAGPKERDWQAGKVLDTARNSYFAGTYSAGSQQGMLSVTPDYDASRSGNLQRDTQQFGNAVCAVYRTYVIESDRYVYLVQVLLRSSKQARVIVNTPVKFSVVKRKLWLIDEDGSEHETAIVNRVLKKP